MAAILAWVLVAAAPVGGLHYQSDAGYELTLPPGFALDPSLPTGETGAAGPVPEGARARIDAAFGDPGQGGHSSIAIAVVDAPLGDRDQVPELIGPRTMAFVKAQLGTDLKFEWFERVPFSGGRAAELAGRVNLDGVERVAQFAFVPAGSRHLILMASMPRERFATLGPQFEASLATLRLSPDKRAEGLFRAGVGPIAAGLLGLLVAVRLQSRRRARR
jgi:hypothetical protein